MVVSIIVAKSKNDVIGGDNRLLWNLPNDMTFFKNTTWGFAVIMGRKTFDSLKGKPLKGRFNIIITRQEKQTNDPQHLAFVHSFKEALEEARINDFKEVFVIGGGQIYELALPYADKIYLTNIEQDFDGDTFFPRIDFKNWSVRQRLNYNKDDKHAYNYSIEVFEKNQVLIKV